MLQTKIKKILRKARTMLFKPAPTAYIPRPLFKAEHPDSKKMLLIVCGKFFHQDLFNTATLMHIGLARSWASECGTAKLISIDQLMKEIELHDNPAVFMTTYEVNQLTYSDSRKLRNVDLFVLVSLHPRANKMLEQKVLGAKDDKDREVWLSSYGKIVMAEPKFVWNANGVAGMEWFQGWIDDGFHWETIYPAADTSRYFPDPSPDRFGHIKMAYVGRYWPEKAQAFDLYLRPWEDILVPFGYMVWPYKNYAGRLDEQGERQLYSSAGLIPLVTSPWGWMMAEITERYLKAPACAGFCIADQNPALREIFAPDELLQAENPEHFHQLVRDLLAGKIDRADWALKGYQAVLKRHTYAHRAVQILNVLSREKA
ncbi:MAG: hypothetical protein C0410_02785 [Anaerolinea sp.]|nr:hypothetical protein [Anaerolinea sp.]